MASCSQLKQPTQPDLTENPFTPDQAEALPKNGVRHVKVIRKAFDLGHDVLRHTFFSMHVAAFKSVGEAALEGGNTEGVLKKHYLNLATYTEGGEFWNIMPDDADKKIVPITSAIKTTKCKTA